MTKSTITRERLDWLSQISCRDDIEDIGGDEIRELASMALTAMDSEPVAWTWHYREQWHVTNDERRAEFVAKDGDVAVLPLYRHAQSAQISEPVLPLQDQDLQGVIDALEHPAGINAAGKQVVRHALVEIQERRKADREPVAEVVSIYGDPEAFGEREIRPLVGIQQMPYGTKLYRHAQPVPVVSADLLHTAASAIEDLLEHTDPNTSYYSGVWADVPGKLRAAMFQAKSLTGNSPVIGIDLASGPDRTVEVHYVAPPGYVMVPKEPTEAMMLHNSGCQHHAWDDPDCAMRQTRRLIWSHMLAAAPQEVK
ncbi:hypothetical protein [Klebsiella pneumoniae]|uniref:hypothetical protein n=1 Tax=Klebsiella pneumoniae TaxID=573 RepID=UPI00101C7DCF|nr:hypothetical protein [Klebsiella pneumoniae]HBX8259757.1 hypothetical protein [Klebsiella pneumoniae]HBZ7606692.1 hypothetical protein [Klebsiella pneumoniae]HCM6022670.1 hypothetical protein [Klebsiella pneumoniae]